MNETINHGRIYENLNADRNFNHQRYITFGNLWQ